MACDLRRTYIVTEHYLPHGSFLHQAYSNFVTDYIGFVLSSLAASVSSGAMPTRHGKKQKKQGNENAAGMTVFPWLPRRKKRKTKSSAKQDLPKVQQQSVNEQAPVEVEPAAQTFSKQRSACQTKVWTKLLWT